MRGVDHPLPPTAEVKERVELYLYSPLGLRSLLQGELYLYIYASEHPHPSYKLYHVQLHRYYKYKPQSSQNTLQPYNTAYCRCKWKWNLETLDAQHNSITKPRFVT
jgi:hypothetical protein